VTVTIRQTLIICAVSLNLGACAAVNPCKDEYGGLCASPREIYGATRNRDQINPTEQAKNSQAKAEKLINTAPTKEENLPSIHPDNPNTLPSNVMDKVQVSPDLGSISAAGVGPSHDQALGDGPISALHDARNVPMPILKQPKVMRVWVAPFVDKNNQLHFPGYVYSVIQDKTWTFGEDSDKVTPPVPSPAQVGLGAPDRKPGAESARPDDVGQVQTP
jgi:conjugal transfer pilus assembly protein TraV